jgi:hypothetical protein
MAALVACTVFVPVAAQAASCAMPDCTSGCCEMTGPAAPAAAGSMTMDDCCDVPGTTMQSSSCPTGSEKPDFKATSGVPEVVSPAVPLGAVALLDPAGPRRAVATLSANARGPGDQLAGTRLRI